ncbi:MAG TPA: PAS domain-containing protein, partial [Ignavibacteriaceae bacterium]|nr:PAS domain-containing protein [Ignavibacteriaceae bacterium]
MCKKNEQEYIHQNQNLEVKYDETLSLLNSTLNAIREGILVVNFQGKIVFFNKKFLEIWSVPEEIIKER